MSPARLTAKQARTVIDGARLVKAPDWSDSRHWHVTDADGQVLVVVKPSYGGASRSGRNGWSCHLAALGPSGDRDRWPTRQSAAGRGLAMWERWITAPR